MASLGRGEKLMCILLVDDPPKRKQKDFSDRVQKIWYPNTKTALGIERKQKKISVIWMIQKILVPVQKICDLSYLASCQRNP